MRLVAVLLVAVLAGCMSGKVFLGEYKKDGATSAQISEDRNTCSKESMRVLDDTPGAVGSYLMQRHMVECMRAKGYEAVDIHPNAFKRSL